MKYFIFSFIYLQGVVTERVNLVNNQLVSNSETIEVIKKDNKIIVKSVK